MELGSSWLFPLCEFFSQVFRDRGVYGENPEENFIALSQLSYLSYGHQLSRKNVSKKTTDTILDTQYVYNAIINVDTWEKLI